MTGIEGEKSPNSNMAEKYPSNPSDPSESDSDGINQEIIKSLEELEPKLDPLEYIHDSFHDIPLICMREATDMELCFRLDPPSDVLAENGLTKDYHGMAEWSKLDPVFIKYLTKTDSKYKTTDVMAKWSTMETEPMPTLGNLQKCLCGEDGIERPDVITDLAKRINKDAFNWKMDKYRANTKKPVEKDYSWQLTRQDMITGKTTYYTACLVYADEDAGMAEVINRLYTRAYPKSTFFRPQFDLRRGKYILETTGRVIQERCGGKAIFLLSEYFFASEVCQFAVNYTAAVCKGAGVGNLVPFHLTPKGDHVPAVLKGIAGIRWFRRGTRKFAWQMVTDTILAQELQQEELRSVYERISQIVDSEQSSYLTDPPYDEDTQPPGEPIKVIEPEGISEFLEQQNKVLQERMVPPKKKLTRMERFLEAIRKRIFKKIQENDDEKGETCSLLSSSDYPPIERTKTELKTDSETDTDSKYDSETDCDRISTMDKENGTVRFKRKTHTKPSKEQSPVNSSCTAACVGKSIDTAKAELANSDGQKDTAENDIVSQGNIRICVSENNNQSEPKNNQSEQNNNIQNNNQSEQINNQSEQTNNIQNNNQSGQNSYQSEQINNQSGQNDNQSEQNDNKSEQNDILSENTINQSEKIHSEQIICDDEMDIMQDTANNTNHLAVEHSDQPVGMTIRPDTVIPNNQHFAVHVEHFDQPVGMTIRQETLNPYDQHLAVEHPNQSLDMNIRQDTVNPNHQRVAVEHSDQPADQCKLDTDVDKVPESDSDKSVCSGVEILYSRRKGRYYTDAQGRLCTSSEYSDTSEEGDDILAKKSHTQISEHDEFI